jgi:hypothetical protein
MDGAHRARGTASPVPGKLDEHVDCSHEPEVVTRPEEMLSRCSRRNENGATVKNAICIGESDEGSTHDFVEGP